MIGHRHSIVPAWEKKRDCFLLRLASSDLENPSVENIIPIEGASSLLTLSFAVVSAQ